MNRKPSDRLDLIDALRGCAIFLMVAYHFCFDLSYFQLADWNFYRDPFWLHARTFILSSFLLLVGVSLHLATASGFKRKPFLRRLGLLIASSALISFATWLAFGERFIFFGVLHFIAFASVVGLLFINLGKINLLLGLGMLAFGNFYESAWFDEPGRRWIGLMTFKPATEDYVPLLPWFGVVLVGIALGPWLKQVAQHAMPVRGRAAQLLVVSGRHSLLIYLLHQPLLMGLLWVATR